MADEVARLRERVAALESKTDGMMARTDHEVLQVSLGFEQQQTLIIDLFHRLEQKMDTSFHQVEQKFHQVEQRFKQVEYKMDTGFAETHARLSRLESKLDLFIEAQTTFNRLIDARRRGLDA